MGFSPEYCWDLHAWNLAEMLQALKVSFVSLVSVSLLEKK
jgi:hypothetical protein